MASRHLLSLELDYRLAYYGAQSWNGYEAVYSFQQLTALMPVFERNLRAMYGDYGIGDARRGWGVIADLASAMLRLEPTMTTIRDLGYEEALNVGYLIPYTGPFALAGSPAARPLIASLEDLGKGATVLFARADAHDRITRPLLKALRAEIQAYDASDSASTQAGFSFRKLVIAAGDEPTDFPEWDGRPLFLHEQKAFLDFLSKKIALEIVANNLVDETLGSLLARGADLVTTSVITGDQIWNVDKVPERFLLRSTELVFGQMGAAALKSLRAQPKNTSALDKLLGLEIAIMAEFDVDIAPALAESRQALIDAAMAEEFGGSVVDISDARSHSSRHSAHVNPEGSDESEAYDFPDLADGS